MHEWWNCTGHSACMNMRMRAAKSQWWARVKSGSNESWKRERHAAWREMQRDRRQ